MRLERGGEALNREGDGRKVNQAQEGTGLAAGIDLLLVINEDFC